jgi:hypothetical protein
MGSARVTQLRVVVLLEKHALPVVVCAGCNKAGQMIMAPCETVVDMTSRVELCVCVCVCVCVHCVCVCVTCLLCH